MGGNAENSQVSRQDDDVRLRDLLRVLSKHRKIIGIVVAVAGALSVLVSLLLPNIYVGTAKILVPQQNHSTAAMVLGQLGGLAGLAGPSLGIKNPNDLYVGMLKSRTVADKIIERFNLHQLYEKDTMVETREKLADHTDIATGKDGLITIEFEDEDPKRAAEVANAYVEELDALTQSLAVSEAAQRRLFFEKQLRQAKDALSDAELSLKLTQEKTGLIKLDDQGRAIIEAVATVRAQILAKEVELRAMRTFATEDNSDYIRVQQQLAGLRAELAKLERAQSVSGGSILLPTGKVPEAGLEYVRKLRDVKYYETMFELLAKQFELAKMDEAKEAVVIQVVDKAVVPDRKAKPKRTLIVAVAVLLAALLAAISAFVVEAVKQDRESRG